LPHLIELLTSLRDRDIVFRALESLVNTSGPKVAVILNTLAVQLRATNAAKALSVVSRFAERASQLWTARRSAARRRNACRFSRFGALDSVRRRFTASAPDTVMCIKSKLERAGNAVLGPKQFGLKTLSWSGRMSRGRVSAD
jgi:hypothetical protein